MNNPATGTAALVVEPQRRRYAEQGFLGAAFGLLVLAALGLLAVRKLASIDELLTAEGADSARAIVYELPLGAELHVPIEPRTEVLRIVAHAYRRDTSLPLTPRPASIELDAHGALGARHETLAIEPPGIGAHVAAEDPALSLGDPLPIDIDVHDVGTGELVVKLAKIADGDGLLVRVFRRERLSGAEATIRDAALDRARKQKLARWTWELDWDELTPLERASLLATRWHLVGQLRGSARELRSLAVALSPAPPRARVEKPDVLVGRVSLRGDERAAMLVHPGTELRVAADPSVVVSATILRENGLISNLEGRGSVVVPEAQEIRGVEIGVDRDGQVDVRATVPEAIEWLGAQTWFRTRPDRPVIIESPDAARVIRVSARTPMDRRDGTEATLSLNVETTGGKKQLWTATRRRSLFDRYETADPLEAPSERAELFVVVPRGVTATLTPVSGAIDLELAERDEQTGPLVLTTRPANAAPPPMRLVGERSGDASFVGRHPSNARAFEGPEARPIVRVARHFVPADAPLTNVALARVEPGGAEMITKSGRPFATTTKAFDLESDGHRPLFVPFIALADEDGKATFELLLDPHAKPAQGLYARITPLRVAALAAGETHGAFVIGDDVPAGHHRLSIHAPVGTRVHLPWAVHKGPRWLGGAFEE